MASTPLGCLTTEISAGGMIVASTLIAFSDGLMIARDIPATRELHEHFCSKRWKVSLRSWKELNTHIAQLLSSMSIF